jgi:IclR family transcriptional regulator, acetate operon repressor
MASPVKSADRTVLILEAFAEALQPLALSELARQIGIPVSACHGLVRTLSARGYLYEVGPRRGYYPTQRWLDKARLIAASDPLLERVAPAMEELAAATGETVVLAKRAGPVTVYLKVIASRHAVRYSAQAGDQKPLHASSIGKAILMQLPPAEREALLSGARLARFTPNTLTSRERLEQDLATGLKRGWTHSRGENVPDVHAIAAALRIGGEPYGLAVAGPEHRMAPNLARHAKRLLRAARRIAET